MKYVITVECVQPAVCLMKRFTNFDDLFSCFEVGYVNRARKQEIEKQQQLRADLIKCIFL
jgi:hypothetical protein